VAQSPSLSAKSTSPRPLREPVGLQNNGVPISPVKSEGKTKARITAINQLYDDIEYELSESETEEDKGEAEEEAGDTSVRIDKVGIFLVTTRPRGLRRNITSSCD
jgi:hypothetical protein